MDYKTWVSKHKGMKSNAQSAQKYYEATGQDTPEPVAKRIEVSDRKQEYGQWLGAQKKPDLQKSNWWSGIKYRKAKGLDATEMQAKARDAYLKRKQGRGAGQAGSTGRPS